MFLIKIYRIVKGFFALFNTEKAAQQAQNTAGIISQLKKAGITPSNNKLNPLYNTARGSFFKSLAGIEARAMNGFAIKGIKDGQMPRPKAVEAEDIKLLSSNAADMVKKWTRWIDPKSGKMYTVINKGNNPDGTRIVRVLNEAGELTAEKSIIPKKIIIIDNFQEQNATAYTSLDYFFKSHGSIVEKFLERNNPVADIEHIHHGLDDAQDIDIFKHILDRIKSGEKIDVINCSFGYLFDLDRAMTGCSTKLKRTYPANKEFINTLLSCPDEEYSMQQKIMGLIEDITSTGTRIVFASGNEGKLGLNLYAGAKGVDVVGALGQEGRIADYSSSVQMLQHLESGIVRPKLSEHGINITGLSGVDVSFKNTVFEDFLNKKLSGCLASEDEIEAYKKLEEMRLKKLISRDDFNNQVRQKFIGKLKPTKKQGEYMAFPGAYAQPIRLKTGSNGQLIPDIKMAEIEGTSYAAPVRSAKIALNKTMREILDT